MNSLPVDRETAIWFSKFKNSSIKKNKKIKSIKDKSKNYYSLSNHLKDQTMFTRKKKLFMNKKFIIKIHDFYKLLGKILSKYKSLNKKLPKRIRKLINWKEILQTISKDCILASNR
jgi:hypothetical protein